MQHRSMFGVRYTRWYVRHYYFCVSSDRHSLSYLLIGCLIIMQQWDKNRDNKGKKHIIQYEINLAISNLLLLMRLHNFRIQKVVFNWTTLIKKITSVFQHRRSHETIITLTGEFLLEMLGIFFCKILSVFSTVK